MKGGPVETLSLQSPLLRRRLLSARLRRALRTIRSRSVTRPCSVQCTCVATWRQVHARYSCDVGTHIWVSVKQSDGALTIDPAVAAEGSGFGGAASAWWQSHRGSFVCDGKRHVGVVHGRHGRSRAAADSSSRGWALGAVLRHHRRGPHRRSHAVVAGRDQPLALGTPRPENRAPSGRPVSAWGPRPARI